MEKLIVTLISLDYLVHETHLLSSKLHAYYLAERAPLRPRVAIHELILYVCVCDICGLAIVGLHESSLLLESLLYPVYLLVFLAQTLATLHRILPTRNLVLFVELLHVLLLLTETYLLRRENIGLQLLK